MGNTHSLQKVKEMTKIWDSMDFKQREFLTNTEDLGHFKPVAEILKKLNEISVDRRKNRKNNELKR
jgi:hypothetical protein